MSSKTPVDVVIEERKPHFEFVNMSDPWIPQAPGLEMFMDTLSCFIPDAERFFIQIIAAFRKDIKDKKLLEDIERFIRQEAQHGLGHNELNRSFCKRNQYAKWALDFYPPILRFFQRYTSRRAQLVYTICNEHFNAIYLDIINANLDWFFTYAKPTYYGIWVWHSIEESEHKGVAYDVYMATTKNKLWAYLLRVVIMLLTSILSLISICTFLFVFCLGRKHSPNFVKVRPKKAWWRMKINEVDMGTAQSAWRITLFLLKHTFKHYLNFYKWSFHPWQNDNRDKLNQLKRHFTSLCNEQPS